MPSTMILEYFGAELVGGELLAARFAINFAVSTIVSRAFAAQPGMSQTSDSGTRQQVPPSNTNSIPVVYGTAYMGGTFVDAVLSTDQQTMYYVMAISHATEGGSHSFDLTKMYYGDQLITFDSSTAERTSVISLTDTAGNVDTKIANNLSIYLYYANEAGTITGYNTNYLPSSTNVMGDTGIDAALRWPSSGRQMNGLMFAIVKLKYNRDAGTTSLSPITFNLTNTAATVYNKPGDVWYDYLTNTKYGAAMDASIVDTVSRDALNAYAEATIPYTPSGGGSATQARYTINGVIDTSRDCLTNLDQMMLACDSWNQYNATTGKWAIVINKEESTSFAFDDSNIVGDIRISAQDITQSINQIEAQFPNSSNKDQQDYVYIQTPSNLLYVNEPVNKYTIKYELVNNSVQAQYLANRQLEQAREDLIVSINTPYPGIQVDAGDVVSITNAFYGWNAKLFRVMKVVESASPEGGLGASLDLTEYNAQVYDNASITAFTPAPNSGLSNPNYFYPSPLTVPSVSAANLSVTVPNLTINVTIPTIGRVTGITLYYRVNGSGSDWKVWLTQLSAGSVPFTPGSTFTFKDVVLPTAAYDFSYTVFNDIGGSAISSVLSNYSWSPYPAKIGTNLVSASNNVQSAIDVNNQYGIAPSSNEIVYINQTYVPSGGGWAYAAHFLATGGDAVPLALTVGGIGSVQAAHMWLQPTSGLPTSFITNGGVAYTGTHMYLADGTNWRQVYCQGDTIPSTPTFTAQSANTVLAGPTSGAAAVPTFRTLVAADVPTLNQNTTGYAAFLQSTTSTGGTHTLQAFQDNTNFIYGYDLRATGTTSPVLRFLDGSTGNVLAALRANSSGLTSIDSTGSPTQFTASVITGTRLVSTIATGTAPLTVASTTRVSNLNVATSGTADALLNGNRQAVAGSNAWDSWNFYSNSSTLSSISLYTSTGTWLTQLYSDGTSTGFLAASGAGTFDLEKVSNGNLYVRIAGVSRAVFNASNIIPIANGGTNATATPTAGAVPYGTGSAYAFTAAGTSGQVLTSNGAGAPTWTTLSSGSGTVTSVSVVSSNGFAGTVATASTTPAITLSTTITGILKGNGTAISAASAGDFPTLNQNTTGYAAFLQSTTSIGGTHTFQAFQDNTNFIYGYDLRATGTTAPALRFLDGSTGNVLGVLRASSSGLAAVDSAGSSAQFSALKFVSSSTAAEVFYGNTSNSTPTINLYTSGTINGFLSATSTGNLNLWNSRTGTGFLLQSGGGINGAKYYAAGTYNTLLNDANIFSYALTSGTAKGVAYLNASNVLTTGTGLVFDGTNLGVGGAPLSVSTYVTQKITAGAGGAILQITDGTIDLRAQINVGGGVGYFGTYTTATPLAFTVGGSEKMRLDSAGNLGLGVTPSAWSSSYTALQTPNGGAFWSAKTGSPTVITSANAYFDGSAYKYLASYAATLAIQSGGQHQWYNAASGTAGNAVTFTQAMTLDSSGNLLVGTTNSSYTADGGFRVIYGASGNTYVASTRSGSTNSDVTMLVRSTGAAADRFYVGMGGTVYATSIVITAISDERLKENIRDIETGLDAIMALKPRRFDWKEGKGQNKKNAAGFIAQEFETVFPECVDLSRPDDEGIEYKNINHETLIPTLVKAIQELKAEIDALKAA